MKLHEIPEGSKIKVEVFDAQDTKIGDFITFHHLDGMYSYCTVDGLSDDGKNLIHLSVMTPLKKVGDYYELEPEASDAEANAQNKKSRPKKIPVTDGSKSASRRNDIDRQARS